MNKIKETYGEYTMPLVFRGLYFVCTCMACPEQYDVWDGDTQVGYVRLRHGTLYADCPDVGGRRVFYHCFESDEWKGHFDDDEERAKYLVTIAIAIKNNVSLS